MTNVRRFLILAIGGNAALSATPSLAQLQQVEITGSSIRRVEAEGALQVQTLTKSDIGRTGVQTTEQLLQTVSAMSSAGQTQTQQGAGLSTYGGSGVSLRGLGEERSLVLVNGRRIAPFSGGSGAVNVNSIPLAAVERVEILKDGASAIYGSDAVAGVVNFILQKNFQGYQMSGTYGTPTETGGGQQYLADIVAGWGDLTKDRFNLTVSGQYSRNKDLFGRDRDYASTATRVPYFVSGATGHGNIQGAWNLGGGPLNLPGTPYVGGAPSEGYGNPLATPTNNCGQINMSLSPSPTTSGKSYCMFDTASLVGLLGQSELTSFTGNFVFRINDKIEVYADGLYSKSSVVATFQPSPLRTDFMETDEAFGDQGQPGSTDRVLLFRATNPNYGLVSNYLRANGLGVLDGQDLGITARVFDFGLRTAKDTTTATRVVVGVRGEVWNQSYDVAVVSNQNKLKGTVTDGYFSQVGFARATQTTDWNPWSLTQSQAFMDAIGPTQYVGATLSGKTSTTNLDATLSGSLANLPAGTMQYAAGYQYREETLQRSPAPAMLSGDIAGLGGATKYVNADRSVNAFFGELNIPVVKNLDLNLALRWDDYSDFGSTTNYKANFRWQPVQTLLLRASYGTGFRAPNLLDLHDPQVLATSEQLNDPVTGGTDVQVTNLSGGNPNLQPETSKQYSLGLVFQPISQLSLGLDYFNIKVDDVISQPSTQEIVSQNAAGNPAYAGLVLRDPLTNQIISTRTLMQNVGTMNVSGMDLDLRYRDKLGPGTLRVELNGTYYFKFDQTTPGGTTSQKVGTVVDANGNPVISSTTGLDGYGVVLRYKQYLSATWEQGPWATTLANQWATGYHAGWDLNGNPTSMPSLSLWDLQVSYSGLKATVLKLGGRNIFNKQPALFVSSSNAFQVGYDPTQYDPRGRFVYLTGTFTF